MPPSASPALETTTSQERHGTRVCMLVTRNNMYACACVTHGACVCMRVTHKDSRVCCVTHMTHMWVCVHDTQGQVCARCVTRTGHVCAYVLHTRTVMCVLCYMHRAPMSRVSHAQDTHVCMHMTHKDRYVCAVARTGHACDMRAHTCVMHTHRGAHALAKARRPHLTAAWTCRTNTGFGGRQTWV